MSNPVNNDVLEAFERYIPGLQAMIAVHGELKKVGSLAGAVEEAERTLTTRRAELQVVTDGVKENTQRAADLQRQLDGLEEAIKDAAEEAEAAQSKAKAAAEAAQAQAVLEILAAANAQAAAIKANAEETVRQLSMEANQRLDAVTQQIAEQEALLAERTAAAEAAQANLDSINAAIAAAKQAVLGVS